MRNRMAVGASLTLVLLVGSAWAAEPLKSGPQVGDRMTPFDPLNINGEDAGDRACQV